MKKSTNRNLWLGTRKTGGRAAGAIVIWGLVFAVLVGLSVFLLSDDHSAANCGIVFSEVMTANESAYPAADGKFYDWFELKNASNRAVSLSGLKVANTYDSRSALSLPDHTLAPGERIIVYCAGYADEAKLYADFALDKDGDSLYLFDKKGNILEYLQIPALGKGDVYALDEQSGEWARSAFYTPGMENTQAAYLDITSEIYAGRLEITELMASNRDTLTDASGETPDWIEIHNTTGETVSLWGWSLTTDMHSRRQWCFPDAEIGPGEYRVVYASAKTAAEGELHASFKLSASGETLYLIDPLGRAASRMQYEALEKDISLSRRSDGSVTTALAASPGFENTSYGATRALGNRWRAAGTNAEGIYINEAICQMATYSDWVEIYNSNAVPVDISGWWLSDNADHPRKWEFPQGTYLQPGEYKILFLNGGVENKKDPAGIRVDFSLSITGNETLVLSRPDGSAVDTMILRAQKSQVSYGRADGYNEYRWFTEPTPGSANTGASYGGSAARVEFSRSGGRITDGPFYLELTSPDGLPIYYTTDGSDPIANSNRYTGPLVIDGTAVVKAVAWSNDYLPSDAVANTYIFETTGDLRLVCISGNRGDLNASGGVLNTGSRTGVDTYVEVYDYDGSQMLSQGCELTLSGRASRITFPQKAFRLVAKSIYGNATFDAQLFSKREYDVFNSFVMRASGQDCQRSHMVDSVITSLAS
ncbi:MAG: lamin tail domain-containing protein, partial [Clostridia bacterium]|nr:lamin tail domain-containing protein [Clostridia bacterium]